MGWLSGWSKRLPIIVSDSDIQGDLTGFPLMVKLSADSGKSNTDVVQALETLFSVSDLNGVSMKEHKYHSSSNPSVSFSKPTSTSVRINSSNSSIAEPWLFLSVRKELLPHGAQIEFRWSTGGSYSGVGYYAVLRDGKYNRNSSAHFPYGDGVPNLGAGNLQQLDYEDAVSSAHTIKETLDLDNSIRDHISVTWHVRDSLSGYNTQHTLYWCRFLDKDDNLLFDVDLSGDLTVDLSGTYQDYARVGDPDIPNHNIGKIAITSADGETQLPVEIESWNFENEEIILWTKTSLSSSTDTTLYLYYGEDQSGDTDYIGAPIVQSTADIVDDDCSSMSGWTDLDSGGVSSVTVEGNHFDFFTSYSTGNTAIRHKTFGYADRVVIEMKINHRKIGSAASDDYFQAYFRGPDSALLLTFTNEGLYLYNDTPAWHLAYPITIETGSWQTWVFDWTEVATSSGILDVYLDGHKIIENEEVWANLGETYPSGNIFFRQRGETNQERRTHVDYIKVGTDIIKKEVWDDNHIGVWHMDKYPTIQKGSTHHLDVTPENMGYANTVTGTLGRALHFNGTDERLYTSNDDWLDTTDLTVSTFFKPDSDTQSILLGRYHSTNEKIWQIVKEPTYAIDVHIGDSDGVAASSQAQTANNTISGGGWNHLAFTFSDGIGVESVYINGQSVGFTGTQTYTSLNQSDNTRPLEIGSHNDGDAYYDGEIDEVRVSSTVRSDDWMKTDYDSILDNILSYGTLEATRYSTDTVSIIYDNPIYNASTLGVEVYDIDISTDYCIAYATLSGVNALAEFKDNLLIGTTLSGILYISTTTITGTNIYSPQNLTPELVVYKQYPEILDNHVKDISACGDYLCVVTISGVDHFNMGRSDSYDRSSGLTAAAEKCFQTCRGRFYYTSGAKIVTIYTHQCDWMEGTTGYEYDSTVSGTLLPPECVVNDISVTEGTSIYGYKNNIILAATSSGVAVIEERPGNEANSRYKLYLLEE